MEADNVNFRPQYVGYGNGEGGFGSSWLLALLLGRRRGDDDCCAEKLQEIMNGKNISDARQEAAEHRAEITEDFRDGLADLKNKICDAEKAGIESRWEAKFAVSEARNDINSKVCEVGHTVREAKCEIEDKIQLSTAAILKQLHEDKLDEKNDEIERLRHRNLFHEQNQIFANQFNSINSVLSHILMQDQKQSSKIVQFGAGNAAVPTNTNNQVG